MSEVGPDNFFECICEGTSSQIAKYMGSAREVVSRLVKYFAQEGYVQPGRGRLTILDPDALRELAGNPREA